MAENIIKVKGGEFIDFDPCRVWRRLIECYLEDKGKKEGVEYEITHFKVFNKETGEEILPLKKLSTGGYSK